MRSLVALTLITLASTCGAIPASDKISTYRDTGNQIHRSLRGNVGDEERGVEKVAEKVDDALAIILHKPLRLPTAALANVENVKTKVQAAMKTYPEGLSTGALQQLRKVEEQRLKDVALFDKVTKKTPDGMRRDIKPFPGMRTAPILTANTGRAAQRYAKDGGRLTACAVVTRPASEGGGILLISSSKLAKQDFLLPKGGWDHGESLHRATWREVLEEGGVNGAFAAALGEQKVGKHYYNSFLMQAVKTYDQWPESMRYRVWLKWDDAITLLTAKNRPEMAEIVMRARDAAARTR